MKILFFLLVSMSSTAFADNNYCVPVAPTVECMDYVLRGVGYNTGEAASVCHEGVTVECMDYVLKAAGYDTKKAALACKGGPTVECMDYVLRSVGYNTIKAAAKCSGR